MSKAAAIRDLYSEMIAHEGDLIHNAFSDGAVVDSPMYGKQDPVEWYTSEGAWLRSHKAAIPEIRSVVVGEDRIACELTVSISVNGTRKTLPVLLVADTRDDLLGDVHIYHSTWPINGKHLVRSPLRDHKRDIELREPVASYIKALAAGDVDMLEELFEDGGYIRQPSGDDFKHVGDERSAFYAHMRDAGGIPLKIVSATDDGDNVVIEFICDEWASHKLPAQGGGAVYERGPTGKIAGARIYDDVDPPEGLFD